MKTIKHLTVLLIITLLLFSCNFIDGRFDSAEQYAGNNINQYGNFDVTILDFKKVDGESFTSKYTGEDMYALDFDATVRANQSGYVGVDEDGKVRGLNFHSDNGSGSIFKPHEVRYINKGDIFVVNNKVIMVKKESGWKPIALRYDYTK